MSETLRFVKSASRRPPDYSDTGNAERFAMQHGKSVRYCAEMSHAPCRGWFIQGDDSGWCPDVTGEVMRRAKRTVESIKTENESFTIGVCDIEKQLAHHEASQCKDRIVAMLELAQSELPIPCTLRDLEAENGDSAAGGRTAIERLVNSADGISRR